MSRMKKRTGKIIEYILVIEGSVPPFVVRRKHSPNLSLPALLAVYRRTGIVRFCRQSRERLGECFLRTTKGGTDPSITNIYSLGKIN